MSSQRSKEVRFTHYNDCESHGCPHHVLTCTVDTSGYVSFTIDGEPEQATGSMSPIYDPHVFEAMIEAYRDANKN